MKPDELREQVKRELPVGALAYQLRSPAPVVTDILRAIVRGLGIKPWVIDRLLESADTATDDGHLWVAYDALRTLYDAAYGEE